MFRGLLLLPLMACVLVLLTPSAANSNNLVQHLKPTVQSSHQQQQQPQQQQHHQQQQSAQKSITPPVSHHHQQQQLQQQQQQQQQQHTPPQAQHQQEQYIHDKDVILEMLKNFAPNVPDDEYNDPYQLLSELKQQEMNSAPLYNNNWNSYHSGNINNNNNHNPIQQQQQQQQQHERMHQNPFEAAMMTPKFMPFFGFSSPPPVFIPYPFFIAPEMFYPASNYASEYEDNDLMGRAAGRNRSPTVGSPGHAASFSTRNSPIYYVRTSLPPTPYMFLPSFAPAPFPTILPSLPSFTPSSLANFPSYSSVYNLPVNFISNGKPGNIYQMGGSPPNDLSSPSGSSLPFLNFGSRPLPPHTLTGFRPTSAPYNFATATQQDSKLLSLKRPYYFNGRPEDIYILSNNYPLYNDAGGYY